MDCDVLTTEDCTGSDEEEESCPGMPLEFKTYWNTAAEKPNNFSAWTKLLEYAESEKNLAACRKAYDAFLLHFPICHIYWKKYADLELHLGNKEEAEKVFDRAVKANPLNVSLWIDYIQYLKKTINMTLTKSVYKLRGLFKEATNSCGMVFHSDELWKMYIEFETQQNNLKEVTALYDRVLTVPTQHYQIYYERFKVFVTMYSPLEILNTEEREWIRLKIQIENDNEQIAAEDPDYESIPESDIKTFREHILKIREKLYLLNEEEVKKRRKFEEGIKRLYFIAAPLNVKQLTNWRKYLQFEVSQGQHKRIVLLYERCLMVCALYEEFWWSYAQYMEAHSVETARSIFARACYIHLPLKYSLHLRWAAFEEKHGCLDSARAILCGLENKLPGLALVRLRRVGLERRNGNLLEAERLLKESAQISSDTKLAGFYAVKLSRLYLKLQRDAPKARAVLDEALKKDPDNPLLHLCMLELEMSKDNAAEDATMVCVERALKRKLPDLSKKILCERRLEYIEDFGNSLTSWFDAFNELQTYLKPKTDEQKYKNVTAKTDSDSQVIYPPGTTPPSKNKSGAPSKESSYAKVSVARNRATTSASFSSKLSFQATPVPYEPRSPLLSGPYPCNQYSNPRPLMPPSRAYFNPPRTNCPPQNVPMQPLFGNRFGPQRENMFPDFCPPMHSQSHFIGPPGPQFVDNSRTPFRMPSMFGYGPWIQNVGPQAWNQFFPPH